MKDVNIMLPKRAQHRSTQRYTDILKLRKKGKRNLKRPQRKMARALMYLKYKTVYLVEDTVKL